MYNWSLFIFIQLPLIKTLPEYLDYFLLQASQWFHTLVSNPFLLAVLGGWHSPTKLIAQSISPAQPTHYINMLFKSHSHNVDGHPQTMNEFHVTEVCAKFVFKNTQTRYKFSLKCDGWFCRVNWFPISHNFAAKLNLQGWVTNAWSQ